MRESITKKQFIISCIINGINTIFYFYGYSFGFNYTKLVFLTIITLDFNCVYLFLSFISDFALFVFKSDILEIVNDFLRNSFCHIINPIEYMVNISFWILIIGGGIQGVFIDTLNTVYSIYSHLIITVLIIIDLFIAEHERHFFSWMTLSAIFVYISFYGILLCIVSFKFDSPPYIFLEKIKWWGFPLYVMLFSIILVSCYFLHIILMKIKYEYILNNKTNSANYNEEINKVIQMTDIIPKN